MTKCLSKSPVKGHDLDGNQVIEVKSTPNQLSLFQQILGPKCSSTIELYDAMPKHFHSSKEMAAMRQKNGGQFLDTLIRPFENRGEKYTLEIRPARIRTKDGAEKEFYPGKSVFLIEQHLRKLSTRPRNGLYLGDQFGAEFSMSELRKAHEESGHGKSYQSLRDGLKIGNTCNLAVTDEAGTVMVSAPIFPVLMCADRQQWLEDPQNARCYVTFNPLVTASLENGTFRETNYEKLMELDGMLAYYLYQRLTHLYRQADFEKPYHIALDTLVRDSGMKPSAYTGDTASRIEDVLDDLKHNQVLMNWTRKAKRGPNNELLNIVYELG